MVPNGPSCLKSEDASRNRCQLVISKLVLALQTFADMVIGFAKARPKISTAESGTTPRLYGWQVAQSSAARSEEELLLRNLTKHGLIRNFVAILSITFRKKLFTACGRQLDVFARDADESLCS